MTTWQPTQRGIEMYTVEDVLNLIMERERSHERVRQDSRNAGLIDEVHVSNIRIQELSALRLKLAGWIDENEQ